MTDAPRPSFSDDSPKQNPWQDDRLGSRPFAERVADLVIGLGAPNGYVIGLHGPWGSGKSTVLNFIQAFVAKHNEENDADTLDVIDFRPWMVAGHQDLVAAFFKVLSEALEPDGSRLAKGGKRALRAVRAGADPVLDAAAKIALAIHPAGVATATIAGASAIGKKAVAGAVDRWLREPSLQSAYEDLRARLTERRRRYLVVVDDIDRLEDDDIRSMFRMVKTVGKLPNVTYLLAYDRGIVWRALDGSRTPDADQPSFAGKIIQQELELPRPGRGALLRILEQETAFLLEAIEGGTRWQEMVILGLRRWIRFPRDVARLSNAVGFLWPAIRGELDPSDVLCMEGIRLFDPGIFEWIQQNRDFLLSEGRFLLSSPGENASVLESLDRRLTPEVKAQQLKLLCLLFPNRTDDFRGKDSWMTSQEPRASLVRRRGMGHPPGYEAYFRFFLPRDFVPKTKVDEAVAHLHDEARQVALLREFVHRTDEAANPLISEYIQELDFRFSGPAAARPTLAFLSALFEVGEEVDRLEWPTGFLVFPPRTHLSLLVRQVLGTWGEAGASSAALTLFERASSVPFCCSMYVDRAQECGRIKPDGNLDLKPLISVEALDRIEAVLLARVRQAARDGSLGNAPVVFDVARAWTHLAGPDEARTWVNAQAMGNPHFIANVALSLVGYSINGVGIRSYSYRDDQSSTVFDLRAMRMAADRHADNPSLSDDERRRVRVLGEGLRQSGWAGGARSAME